MAATGAAGLGESHKQAPAIFSAELAAAVAAAAAAR